MPESNPESGKRNTDLTLVRDLLPGVLTRLAGEEPPVESVLVGEELTGQLDLLDPHATGCIAVAVTTRKVRTMPEPGVHPSQLRLQSL